MSFKTGDRVIYHDDEGWHTGFITHVAGAAVAIDSDQSWRRRASTCRPYDPAVWERIQELEALLEVSRGEVADLEHQQRAAFLTLDTPPEGAC